MAAKSSVIGISLGSAESYVGYVGKGIVDVCQNEVSKRATPTLVGFTDRERLLGDSALALIKSNAKNTCRNFKHLLGQSMDSPQVEEEHFWSTSKIVQAEDGFPGYEVMYKGEQKVLSAVQVCAMFLTKLKEVTEKWTGAKVADCVIGVPTYYSDVHRQAVLDAAKIAGISVLRLINEPTATALAYGIYRSNDFDLEKPMTVAFCSMGLTTFSVSIVQFTRGKLTMIYENSDKVGGRDMDLCLIREFAAQFKKKTGCDVLSNKKACLKLEDAVSKTKKILSANYEAGISCECLMDDEDFASDIKRDDYLEMCKPMMDKVQAVLDKVKEAVGSAMLESIDSIEVVGGATRVPWVKEMCKNAFGKELSTTMNADESVARGCALQAAILSPLYKVRDFKVEDFSPNPISIRWMGSAADSEPHGDETESNVSAQQMTAKDGEDKAATVFPVNSPMNTWKLLTFYRKGPFDIRAEYADMSGLQPGSAQSIGNYRIDLPPQSEVKKVKVKAKLSLSGVFAIDGAQLVEDEEYEETVKEKREIEPTAEDAAAAPAAPNANEADAEAKPEDEAKPDAAKEPEKKYEWVDVLKTKKRTKKTDVNVIVTGNPGLTAKDLQALMDYETKVQVEMADLIETDEKRNDLEAYIFNMRDKTTESGDYGAFISPADREKFHAELTKVEDWIYDHEDGTKVMYIDKLDELKKFGEPVAYRSKESQLRGECISALSGSISKYTVAAESPGDKYGHISPDKLNKIIQECQTVSKWLSDLQDKQAGLPKFEKPVLVSADMEKKGQELAKFADEILKEPKPKAPEPPKEEKKEEAPKEETPVEEPPKEAGVLDVD